MPFGSALFVNVLGFQPTLVQLFPQMFALEGHAMQRFTDDLRTHLRPKTLIITLRYTDWWFWEDNAPLRVDSGWMNEIKFPRSMEQLVMEFETRNGKKEELDALISKQISKWRFAVEKKVVEGDDGEMVASTEEEFLVLGDGKPVASTWIGSAKIGSVKYSHHAHDVNGSPDGLGQDEMLYYVVKMVWKRERVVVGRNW
jgi:hypothetical protein